MSPSSLSEAGRGGRAVARDKICGIFARMPIWDSDQYLSFANERTQPSVDLAARVAVEFVRHVVDLGCGPGNSTAVLARRWPAARITGLDSSPSMLATARRDHPDWNWVEADIATWARTGDPTRPRHDVVFANAALQWVPGHVALLPNLLEAVASGGALAFQIPHTENSPHQCCLREQARDWHSRFTHAPAVWSVAPVAAYYDALAPVAARVDLWLTDYAHILAGPEGIVEWYRGTGLRPYLEALPDADSRRRYLTELLERLRPHFPPQRDGKVLMFFRRLFAVAYR